MTGYAELQVTSNFSFLRGASHPEELIAQAAALGLDAIAIADRNSLAGIVRAHVAAQETGLRLVIGCRLDLDGDESLLCFPTDRAAYGRLARLLTLGKRRAPKGECRLGYDDLLAHGEGQILVALADRPGAGVRRRHGAGASGARGGLHPPFPESPPYPDIPFPDTPLSDGGDPHGRRLRDDASETERRTRSALYDVLRPTRLPRR